MKQLSTLLTLIIALALYACGGGSKFGSEEAVIDYSKHVYFRGKVKQMEIKGHTNTGDIAIEVDTCGNITEINYGEGKKVQLSYDAEGNIVKYVANAEAYMLPMFDDTYVEPWFAGLLNSYYDADITLSYKDGKIDQFTDAKKGWTQKFSYNKEGRISGAKISDKKNGRFNNPTYTYLEEEGKMTVRIMQMEQISYTYDAEGRLIESDVNITGVTYDDKNEVSTMKPLAWNDDCYGMVPTQIITYTYTYDKQGNWIKREGKSQKWNHEEGAPAGEEQAEPVITRNIVYY